MWPAVGTSNSTELFFLLDLVECCLLRMPIDRLRGCGFKVGIGVHEMQKLQEKSESFGVHEVKGKVRIYFLS
jgi:hypothetical protein